MNRPAQGPGPLRVHPPHPAAILTAVSPVLSPTTRGRWSIVSAVVCAVAFSSAIGAVTLQALHRVPPPATAYWVMDVLSAVVYGTVALVMLPRTRHPVAWIVVLVAVGCGFSGFATQYYSGALSGMALPGADAVVAAGAWVWMPGTYASMAIMPWIVAARRPPAWVRPVVAVGVLAIAVGVLRVITMPVPFLDKPWAVTSDGWTTVLQGIGFWPERVCVALALGGVVRLLWLREKDRAQDRRGLGWLVIGQVFMALAFIPVMFELGPTAIEVSGLLLILAQAFLPVALLVVVLGQQLWGIDVAVSRVTVWTLLSGAVLAAYGALAWAAGHVLPGFQEIAGVLAVGLVLALGQPLRFWLQRRVDALIYGPSADPVQMLTSLHGDEGSGSSSSSLEALVDALREGLRLGSVEVRSEDGVVKARSGRPLSGEHTLPLGVAGRHLGELVVAAPPGQRLDARTLRLVEQMAGVLGVALELTQVNERLATTSGRLVEVRHEERRMLRRDLHDGMGPALAGVGLGLAAAQRRLSHDPEGTAALLAELETEVERRTEDVRLLARALLPVQLDNGDLCQALEVLADRFRASGLIVRTELQDAVPLPIRRQIAVYHVAAEALMNAYRHARATEVGLNIRATPDGTVSLSVTDDGQGFADGHGAGIGLQSMRERCAELGGTLEVAPRDDGPGTLVRMTLP